MKPIELLDEAIKWMELMGYMVYEKALEKIRKARDMLEERVS